MERGSIGTERAYHCCLSSIQCQKNLGGVRDAP
jgi:hypothetical protein